MPKPVFSCFGTRTLELPHFERIADRFRTDSARFFHTCPGRFGLIFKTTGAFFIFRKNKYTKLGGNHYDWSRALLRQEHPGGGAAHGHPGSSDETEFHRRGRTR